MRSDDPFENRPERPRAEPEIIPPGQDDPRDRAGVWSSYDQMYGRQRIFVAQPGPFSTILALMIGGLVLAGIVLLLLGFVLFWIPVVIFVVAALLLSGYARYAWRRFQHWLAHR